MMEQKLSKFKFKFKIIKIIMQIIFHNDELSIYYW